MKKVLTLAVISTSVLLLSCSKENNDDEEIACPVVAANAVPQQVKDSFNVRYPATIVIKWFNKDNTGYSAYFEVSDTDKLVHFSNTGMFIKEETEHDQHGQHVDNTTPGGKSTSEGCECEMDD